MIGFSAGRAVDIVDIAVLGYVLLKTRGQFCEIELRLLPDGLQTVLWRSTLKPPDLGDPARPLEGFVRLTSEAVSQGLRVERLEPPQTSNIDGARLLTPQEFVARLVRRAEIRAGTEALGVWKKSALFQ